jgi:hypothetical protein
MLAGESEPQIDPVVTGQPVEHGLLVVGQALPHHQQERRARTQLLPDVGEQTVTLVGADEAQRAEQAAVRGQSELSPRAVSRHAFDVVGHRMLDHDGFDPGDLAQLVGGRLGVHDHAVSCPVDRREASAIGLGALERKHVVGRPTTGRRGLSRRSRKASKRRLSAAWKWTTSGWPRRTVAATTSADRSHACRRRA